MINICPSCQTNQPTGRFCSDCGQPLAVGPAAPTEPGVAAPYSAGVGQPDPVEPIPRGARHASSTVAAPANIPVVGVAPVPTQTQPPILPLAQSSFAGAENFPPPIASVIPQDPWGPQPTRASGLRRPGPIAGFAVATVVVVAGLFALGGAFSGGGSHTITGTLTVSDSQFADGTDGDDCAGQDGYDDLDYGTQVQVKDGGGATLATSNLDQGYILDSSCVFEFTVTDVPSAAFYEVSAGNSSRGGPSYKKADLESNDWNVDLTLGD